MLNVAVLISGSGSNLRALLDAAQHPDFPARVVCVGADTDAPGLAHAAEAGVPSWIIRPEDFASRTLWGEALLARLKDFGVCGAEPWLVVSAGLMRILPVSTVEALEPRLINTHPALLPLFPGAHAVRDALAAGVSETGVTVHLIDEGVDTGRVLRQRVVEVRADDTEAVLHERIKAVERPLLVDTVRDIANGVIDLTVQSGVQGVQDPELSNTREHPQPRSFSHPDHLSLDTPEEPNGRAES